LNRCESPCGQASLRIITDGRPPWNELVILTNHIMGWMHEHDLNNTTGAPRR
jgi:hypothetical protein